MAARSYRLRGGSRAGLRSPSQAQERGAGDLDVGVLGVAALVGQLQGVIQGRFHRVMVQGEISGFKRAASGHCYFTLKDERAQLSSVFFRGAAARSRLALCDGLEVLVTGRVSIYEARGQLQLIVDRLEGAGEGALRAAFEALRTRLKAEGLFAPDEKRPLPELPRRVGVVSSSSGAAIHDFLQVLGRRAPQVSVLLASTRVQGVGASAEISRALQRLDAEGCDVLVLTRGGGSLEDLCAFNEEALVRAIAACRTPVISAVGHEVDITLSDLVADCRAPTPSAAAEIVAPPREALEEELLSSRRRLESSLRVGLERQSHRLLRFGARLVDPRAALGERRQQLDRLHARTRRAVDARLRDGRNHERSMGLRLEALHPRRRLSDRARVLGELGARLGWGGPVSRLRGERARLAEAETALMGAVRARLSTDRLNLVRKEASLAALSPQAVLDRGFALVADASGRLLRDAAQVGAGDELMLRLARGRVVAQAVRVEVQPPSGIESHVNKEEHDETIEG